MRERVDLLPKINQLIYISLDDEDYSYKSRVAELSKKILEVEMPIDINTGRVKVIPEGSYIKVWYTTNEQGHFTFETKVLGSKTEQVPLLLIEQPKYIKRLQRRDYLRIPASVEVAFKVRGKKDDWQVVRTIDISGGGLQFVLPFPKEIYITQELEGWIVLPFNNGNIEHIKFQGTVVRVMQPHEDVKANWVSIKINQLKENMREKIIRFCYEKQVEYRKKSSLS